MNIGGQRIDVIYFAPVSWRLLPEEVADNGNIKFVNKEALSGKTAC